MKNFKNSKALFENNKLSNRFNNLQLLAPILRCNKCCILGPKAPNRCGGRPRASNSACRRPTSLSSLSESAPGPEGPPLLGSACVASCGDGGSSEATI